MWPYDKSPDAQSSLIRTIFPDTDLSGVIYDCPHAGRIYPADFRFSCPKSLLERAEDTYVDRLIAHAPQFGIPMLGCKVARSYIDVNRRINEIDTDMLSAEWLPPIHLSPHVEAGIGLVRRLLTPSIPVYRRQLEPQEIQQRIDTVYQPYHNTLHQMMHDMREQHGFALLLDWHSMPGKMLDKKGFSQRMPDIIIGDLHRTASSRIFTDAVAEFFTAEGYHVTFNEPYSGQEIIRRWGKPEQGFHAIQIELNKALYLEETSNVLHGGFKTLRATLDKFHIFVTGLAKQASLPLAAD